MEGGREEKRKRGRKREMDIGREGERKEECKEGEGVEGRKGGREQGGKSKKGKKLSK